MRSIDYTVLPVHMRQATSDYVERGILFDDFLKAVFSNELVGAYAAADDINAARMMDWATFLYGQCPRGCWGSATTVEEWQKHHGLEGA